MFSTPTSKWHSCTRNWEMFKNRRKVGNQKHIFKSYHTSLRCKYNLWQSLGHNSLNGMGQQSGSGKFPKCHLAYTNRCEIAYQPCCAWCRSQITTNPTPTHTYEHFNSLDIHAGTPGVGCWVRPGGFYGVTLRFFYFLIFIDFFEYFGWR